MKKILLLSAALVCTSVFSSCVPQTMLYSWYDSENASYQYNKKHTEELQVALFKQYAKMDAKQKGLRKVVPPGFYAEYGYALVSSGKQEEGISFLKKEIQLYPESEAFVSRILKQIEQ